METKGKFVLKGVYEFELIRDGKTIDKWTDENLIPDEGLNHILNVVGINATVRATNWYVGLIDTAHSVVAGDTASALAAIEYGASKYTDYLGSTTARPILNFATSTAKSLTNSASRAQFNIITPTTILNAFVTNTVNRGDGTGVCISSLVLSPSRAVILADQLLVGFTLTAASV